MILLQNEVLYNLTCIQLRTQLQLHSTIYLDLWSFQDI